MPRRLLMLLLGIACWQFAWATECPMRPLPIDIKRIAHNTFVKSYIVGKERLSLTALLNNGRLLKLVHRGCDHSGATVSLWLETNLTLSDTNAWVKEANTLAHIAFAPEIANDIEESLQRGDFERNATEARVAISASPSSFMSYSVVISSTEHGLLLTISYELG